MEDWGRKGGTGVCKSTEKKIKKRVSRILRKKKGNQKSQVKVVSIHTYTKYLSLSKHFEQNSFVVRKEIKGKESS